MKKAKKITIKSYYDAFAEVGKKLGVKFDIRYLNIYYDKKSNTIYMRPLGSWKGIEIEFDAHNIFNNIK